MRYRKATAVYCWGRGRQNHGEIWIPTPSASTLAHRYLDLLKPEGEKPNTEKNPVAP